MFETKKIEIQSIASNGKGTGFFLENGFKKPYFISFTCPGDIVKVRVIKKKKKYADAEVFEYIKKSNKRSKIKCKHYTVCGGCNLLHIKYKYQLEYKKEILKHIFNRNNINVSEIEIFPSEPNINYRYKSKVFFTKNKCGFKKRKSNSIVKISECYIVHKKIINAIRKINNSKSIIAKNSFVAFFIVNEKDDTLALYAKKSPRLLNVLQNNTAEFVSPAENILFEYEYFIQKKYKLFYSPLSFLQSNLNLNKLMVKNIYLHLFEKNITLKNKKKRLLDLYCGNGNISLPLTKLFKEVTFVDSSEDSIKMLNLNLKENKINNAVVKNDYVHNFLNQNKDSFDAIILDPPRIGCGKEVIENVARKKPALIVYVSCNPLISIKEIKLLIKNSYRIDKIQMYDMFPHTNHIEFVAFLTLNNAERN